MESRHIMVILIVAIVMIAGVLRARYTGGRRHRHARDEALPARDEAETVRLREEVKMLKERELQRRSELTAEKAAQYAAHTERLEQRVRVLERIATDKGVDLADEIERLRDDRPN